MEEVEHIPGSVTASEDVGHQTPPSAGKVRPSALIAFLDAAGTTPVCELCGQDAWTELSAQIHIPAAVPPAGAWGARGIACLNGGNIRLFLQSVMDRPFPTPDQSVGRESDDAAPERTTGPGRTA